MIRVAIAALLALLVAGCGTDEPTTAAEQTHPRPQKTTVWPTPQIGDPWFAVDEPKTITIPEIGVRAKVVPVGLNADGSMQTPRYGRNEAGWYVEGPKPGEPGPAVIAAHVDNQNGPDVFYRLDELDKGDEVTVVDRSGHRHRFTVMGTEAVDKDELPYERIWSNVDRPVLRLITCAGDYDHEAGEYRDNLIVYAKAVNG